MLEVEKERHAKRRKMDFVKAIRKKKLSESTSIFGNGFYDNLHQYSKNKIHCSCPMCACKVTSKVHNNTYHRKGKNWSIADLKKIERMEVDDE